jgi:hypothetical protein
MRECERGGEIVRLREGESEKKHIEGKKEIERKEERQ